MFDFLFGAKRRRKPCRKPARRRRYKSSNANCNGSLKRNCKKPGCVYAKGRKFYGCRAAKGFAKVILSMGIPPEIAPVVAQQIKEVADAAAQTAVEQGADPVAAAGAAAADMVAAEGASLGLTPQQTAEVAVQAAGQAAQQVATEQGATPTEAKAAAQEVAEVAAAAGPPILNPLLAASQLTELDSPVLNPMDYVGDSKLVRSGSDRAPGWRARRHSERLAPNTPPPSSDRGLEDALNAVSAFGYRRRSRFGGTECTAYNNNPPGCLTQMEGNRYKCIYKSNGSCSLRPNRSFKTKDQILAATGAANYEWYAEYFGVRNIGGLGSVSLPPTPPPVMASYYSPPMTPEPYIFGSAQMTGPGPGRSAKAVAAYCKRFNLKDCGQQLNCEVWGNSCRARRGAGALGYESEGLLPNTRWSGPINRPGYRRPNTPYVPPRPVSKPPPPPGAPPAKSLNDIDSDDENSFGYRRRKSRSVSLKSVKAKCRRLGVRTTTGKSRKPKTIAQLKRQCAKKSSTRRRSTTTRRRTIRRATTTRRRATTTRRRKVRRTTTRRRTLPNCKGLTESRCGSNPNCQYTSTGCRRRYGTISRGSVYQGPQLPGFGLRRSGFGKSFPFDFDAMRDAKNESTRSYAIDSGQFVTQYTDKTGKRVPSPKRFPGF